MASPRPALPSQFFPAPRPCHPAQARTPAGRRLQKRVENQSLVQKPWAAAAAPAVAQQALSPCLSPLALRTWQSLRGAEVSPTAASCLSPLPQCQQRAGARPTLKPCGRCGGWLSACGALPDVEADNVLPGSGGCCIGGAGRGGPWQGCFHILQTPIRG